jgi:hypothetical protein
MYVRIHALPFRCTNLREDELPEAAVKDEVFAIPFAQQVLHRAEGFREGGGRKLLLKLPQVILGSGEPQCRQHYTEMARLAHASSFELPPDLAVVGVDLAARYHRQAVEFRVYVTCLPQAHGDVTQVERQTLAYLVDSAHLGCRESELVLSDQVVAYFGHAEKRNRQVGANACMTCLEECRPAL